VCGFRLLDQQHFEDFAESGKKNEDFVFFGEKKFEEKKHYTMKPFNIKTSIFVIFATLLALFAPQQTSAQELFNGVVTYKMSMNGASAQTYTVYYRGHDYMTDMPLTKLRTLYLSEEKKMYSIMSMLGKPMVSSFDYDVETSSLEIFDETTPTEEIAGHHCLRITTDSENEMMEGKVTIWIDTSYHIASQYGMGLPVRTETRMQMQGRTIETVSELVSVVAGEVDDALFAVPGKEGAVWMTIDADGNPVISGDTTGLYAPIHSERIEEVDSVGFRKAISNGKTVCMFTAVWCGPCRLMYPRLENVAKQLGRGYRFIKVDLDRCRTIAQEYDCMTIPVVILFENGKEVRRITSAAYGEEDILKFVEGR
jgi:thiol-disulfide isomerase/thioredoxin